jgi:hypothetical protein
MLGNFLGAEKRTGWKEQSRGSQVLKDWQRARGRPSVDGLFGPGDAQVLAQETGLLPIVRFWPSRDGANPRAALERFRSELGAISESASEPRRSQLLAAINREQGQSFGAASGLPAADGGVRPVHQTISI